MAHNVQMTLSLPTEESFNEACLAVWNLGGFVGVVPKTNKAINIIATTDNEAAIRAAVGEIVVKNREPKPVAEPVTELPPVESVNPVSLVAAAPDELANVAQ